MNGSEQRSQDGYLSHGPLSRLLSWLHAVQALPLVGWNAALLLLLLLLDAHVAAVGHGHHGPSSHHRGGRDGSAHACGEPLWMELHLRLAHVQACWREGTARNIHITVILHYIIMAFNAKLLLKAISFFSKS